MRKHPLKGLRVHVEGMGLTGSLLAYHLERWGCEWTWHDSDAQVTAWKASTGAIYPAGRPGSVEEQCYRVWERWVGPPPVMTDGERTESWRKELQDAERPYPLKHFETAAYWFTTKRPPHEGKYEFDGPSKHGLSVARPFSFHINAQTFVPTTRKKFASRRLSASRNVHVYIVAHGFSARLERVVWGWTVPVSLRYAKEYEVANYRPCFYFREGRFVMAYAYPMPGGNTWYAGSSLIPQKRPSRLEIPLKYERWKENFERLGGGAVKVVGGWAPLEGWRPSEGDAHKAIAVERYKSSNAKLVVPPLWHNGIRCFPRVLQQLQAHLIDIGGKR